MATVLLDDKPVTSVSDDWTVSDVISGLQDQLKSQHRLIMRLDCDGNTVEADQLDAVLAAPLKQFERVEFHSEHPRSTILAALRQAETRLPELQMEAASIADALVESRTNDALEAFTRFVRGFSEIHEVVLQTRAMVDTCGCVGQAESPIDGDVGKLAEHLRTLRDSLQSQDYVSLGDQLRYDIEPLIESWSRIIASEIQFAETLPQAN